MQSNSITYVLATFAIRLRDIIDKRMKEIGIHGGQVFVINLLWETDGQSQADIVRRLGLTAPTVYSMVVRLADNGLVELRKDPDDARLMRVFLTAKGREIESDVRDQWEKIEVETFANLTETEKMMLTMLVQKASGNNG